MNWSNMSEFLAMGGYGLYVWGSYAVAAALLLLETWLVLRHRREALRAADHPTTND